MSSVPEGALIARLLEVSAVTDIVGDRIYPHSAPMNCPKPYIVVRRPPGQVNGQTGAGLTGVARTPLLAVCAGEDFDESRSMGVPVSNALIDVDWSINQVWGGVSVGCFKGEDFDQSMDPMLADEIGFPCEVLTFELEHST